MISFTRIAIPQRLSLLQKISVHWPSYPYGPYDPEPDAEETLGALGKMANLQKLTIRLIDNFPREGSPSVFELLRWQHPSCKWHVVVLWDGIRPKDLQTVKTRTKNMFRCLEPSEKPPKVPARAASIPFEA